MLPNLEPGAGPREVMTAAVAAFRERRYEAAAGLIEASGLARQSPELCYLMGACAAATKRLPDAIGHFERALTLKPEFTDAWMSRGLAQSELGRHAEALASFDCVLAQRPADAGASLQRSLALKALGRKSEALEAAEAALRQQPGFLPALAQRGALLKELGRPGEALASYDEALRQLPSSAQLWVARGTALEALSRDEEALSSYDKALALDPAFHDAAYNRGNVLKSLGRLDEALASYERAIALRPASVDAWSNRGVALLQLGRLDEAVSSLDRALEEDPLCHSARFNRGIARLSQGDYRQGWPDYESRFLHPKAPPRFLTGPWPQFQGEDLEGRTLLVHAEQGMGDLLQFVRYLAVLRGPDRKIVFAVPKLMQRILGPALEGIVVRAEFGADEYADFQCPLMSLPGILATTLATVPANVPYLRAEPERVEAWRARIGGTGLRIGIAWQGKPTNAADRGRSLPLRAFASLAALEDVRLVSLQKHHGLEQLTDLTAGMRVETMGEDCDAGPDAFIDTAAVMMSLDLVVTSDTAIAHLAGALGVPTFVALKRVPDWRWGLTEETTPWYPALRLFRQRQDGDWGEVFRRIAAAVAERG